MHFFSLLRLLANVAIGIVLICIISLSFFNFQPDIIYIETTSQSGNNPDTTNTRRMAIFYYYGDIEVESCQGLGSGMFSGQVR